MAYFKLRELNIVAELAEPARMVSVFKCRSRALRRAKTNKNSGKLVFVAELGQIGLPAQLRPSGLSMILLRGKRGGKKNTTTATDFPPVIT